MTMGRVVWVASVIFFWSSVLDFGDCTSLGRILQIGHKTKINDGSWGICGDGLPEFESDLTQS